MSTLLLGCATCSVHDCVKTELRTVLALAFGDRSNVLMRTVASRRATRNLPSCREEG